MEDVDVVDKLKDCLCDDGVTETRYTRECEFDTSITQDDPYFLDENLKVDEDVEDLDHTEPYIEGDKTITITYYVSVFEGIPDAEPIVFQEEVTVKESVTMLTVDTSKVGDPFLDRDNYIYVDSASKVKPEPWMQDKSYYYLDRWSYTPPNDKRNIPIGETKTLPIREDNQIFLMLGYRGPFKVPGDGVNIYQGDYGIEEPPPLNSIFIPYDVCGKHKPDMILLEGMLPYHKAMYGEDLIGLLSLEDKGHLIKSNYDSDWVAFIVEGRRILFPLKPYIQTIAWIDLYNAGAVYCHGTEGFGLGEVITPVLQNARCKVMGIEYAITLFKGATRIDVPLANILGYSKYYVNSEYDLFNRTIRDVLKITSKDRGIDLYSGCARIIHCMEYLTPDKKLAVGEIDANLHYHHSIAVNEAHYFSGWIPVLRQVAH